MYEIGRLVVKTAGRDAGRIGVIIKVIDDKYVMIDGFTRRKKVNKKHIIPLSKTIKIKEEESREKIIEELKKVIDTDRIKIKL